MKIKLEIKNRFTGKVLFEFETENNTIKETLKQALLSGANLRNADLGGADLGCADLRGADLRNANLGGADLGCADLGCADLRGANLGCADLGGANLRNADLRGANLRNADLGGADLGGADLRNADGENIKIEKIVLFDNLYIYQCGVIVSNDGMIYIKLGCFTRLASEWENDFWNNNNEFPNDDSIKSKNRVFAYNVCKMWIENNIVAN